MTREYMTAGAHVKRILPSALAPALEEGQVSCDEDSFLVRLERATERQKKLDEDTLCKMDPALAHRCSDAHARGCENRASPACPRALRRVAADRRAELRGQALKRGVPEQGLFWTFDRIPARSRSIEAVERYIHSDKSLLLLSGTNGCGKTCAAAWACSMAPSVPWDLPGRFVSVADIDREGRYGDLLKVLVREPLVAVDDLSQGYLSTASVLLEELVNSAFQRRARLILVSDVPLMPEGEEPGLFKRLGPRITTRILNDGMYVGDLGEAFRVG